MSYVVVVLIFFKNGDVFILRGMLDLSSLTRDQTCTLCLGSSESLIMDHQGSP